MALLNPAHVKGYRKALAEQDKTDPDDARLIEHYYRSVGVEHPYQFADRYLRLRTFSRAYARVLHTLAAEKAYFVSVLYLWGSEYQRCAVRPFSDLLGVTSQFILDEYADIQQLSAIPEAELAALLEQHSHHTLRQPQETAQKLHQVAQHSYPLPAPLGQALHQVLHLTLELLRVLSDNQNAYRQLLEAELALLPEAQRATGKPRWPNWPGSGGPSKIRVTRRESSRTSLASVTPICASGWSRRLTPCSGTNRSISSSIGKSIVKRTTITIGAH